MIIVIVILIVDITVIVIVQFKLSIGSIVAVFATLPRKTCGLLHSHLSS